MFGSPLGAMLAGLIADGATPPASRICLAVAALMLALNLALLVAALFGVRRIGPLRAVEGSSGAAAIEIRDALGL